jgi:hypothetical protein
MWGNPSRKITWYIHFRGINKEKGREMSPKTHKQIGKHGLTGNTGLGVAGFFHVSMAYDSNGLVFVEWRHRQKLPNGKIEKYDWWKRMTLKRALKEKRKIIECEYCNRPAASLDHFWPYMSDDNFCKEHYESRMEIRNARRD